MEDIIDSVSPDGVKYDVLQVYEGGKFKTLLNRKYKERKPYKAPDSSVIKSFIPGTIRKIFVTEGQKVAMGDELLTLDAMKMINELRAPMSGVVKKIHVKAGQIVANKAVLIELSVEVKPKATKATKAAKAVKAAKAKK